MERILRKQVVVGYKEIYPDEPMVDIGAYLEGISRETVLTVMSGLLGHFILRSKFADLSDLLKMWFGSIKHPDAQYAYNKCVEFRGKVNTDLRIITPYTSLQLFEYAFENLGEINNKTTEEINLSLFKAYLTLNEITNDKEDNISKSIDTTSTYENYVALHFTQSFKYSDIINFKYHEVFTCQTIRAILLFEFLSSDSRSKELVENFLAYYRKTSWQEFLKAVLPIAISILKKKNESSLDLTVTKDTNYENSIDFLEKIIISDYSEISDLDFRVIREKPLYKIEEGRYRVIYDLFVIEKISKGLYFDLSRLNQGVPKDKKIKDFRSFYTYDFSEKQLLYKTIELIFESSYKQISGDDFEKLKFIGGPDYYIQNKNKILLFESKDFLIKSEVKQSNDYEIIKRAVRDKLYYDEHNGNKEPKAILQLLSNIAKILKGKFSPDEGIDVSRAEIYPLIVIHDRTADIIGLNKIIQAWYNHELKKLVDKGMNITKVRMITLIDIDTLIYYHVGLRLKKTALFDIIDEYHKKTHIDAENVDMNTTSQTMLEESMVPFSAFVGNRLRDKKLFRHPKEYFVEKGHQLFVEEYIKKQGLL